MEIRVLRYFLVTAREQNITKAAELLHITQPTLSRQLAALEEELGTSLFIRGNKKNHSYGKGNSAKATGDGDFGTGRKDIGRTS